MSQNNARISEEVRKGLEQALSPMLHDMIGSIIMPVIPSSLAMLSGWTWKTENIIDRRILTRGAGRIPLTAPIQNEKGWLNNLLIVFSDPLSMLHFRCDNWEFSNSPFLMNTIGMINPNNNMTYNLIYNPATPLGPLYGLHWSPSQFWPYNSQVLVEASHPATAPTATSQLVFFSLGRHYIRDQKQFYESIIIEGKRQSIGKVEVNR